MKDTIKKTLILIQKKMMMICGKMNKKKKPELNSEHKM